MEYSFHYQQSCNPPTAVINNKISNIDMELCSNSIINKDTMKRIVFGNPLTPDIVVAKYKHMLNSLDLNDIYNYQLIYYVHNETDKILDEDDFDDFDFSKHSHIAYRYEQLQLLGNGAYGTVVKCYDHKMKRIVAIKVIDNLNLYKKHVENEIHFMNLIKNCEIDDSVALLSEYFEFRGLVCLVMPCYYIDLYKYLVNNKFKGLLENQIHKIGKQLVQTLSIIHNKGVIHGDLKPENVMFVDNNLQNIALIDFGCSCAVDDMLYKKVQSIYYRAPEVVYGFKYSTKIDTWSIGCILFELGCGRTLFTARSENLLSRQFNEVMGLPPAEMVAQSSVMQKQFATGVRVNRSLANENKRSFISSKLEGLDSLVDVICACIDWLPARRPTMNEILDFSFFK